MLQAQENNPLQQLESVLKTGVVDILRLRFQTLAEMDRAAAYEAVLNQPMLLHDSFVLLQREPMLFSEVILDESGTVVEPMDEQRLSCGETLGNIKTLLLRASARRHFRRKLGGTRIVSVEIDRDIGPVLKLLETIGLKKPPPPKQRKMPGRGDRLYSAMRDYLVYDWQARLIPHYTQFTPELVNDLGMSLLEIREPSELRALAGEEGKRSISQRRRPLFLSSARVLIKAGSDRIDSDILWKLWEQMGLGRLFDQKEGGDSRKIIAEIAATSRDAIEILMPILGEDIRLFVGFLFIAHRQLGRNEFRNIFNEDGATQWMAKILGERLAQMPHRPLPELSEMQRIFTPVLAGRDKPA